MAELQLEFETLLSKTVGDDIAASTPITDRSGLHEFREGLEIMGVRLRSDDKARIASITDDDYVALQKFIWGVAHIEVFHASFNAEGFNIKGILKMIALPQNRFPTSYQGLADYLIEKFERQHWGEPPKGEKDTGAISKKSKRLRDDQDESGTIAKKPKRVSLDKNEIKQPPPNHPIFGKEGIMRGTLWYLTEGPTSRGVIALDENYERKDSKVFGHNGLKVGDWWARSLAALRDGAHGQRTAGVSGSLELGAYSVIISNDGKRQGGKHKGGYGGVDKDDGNTVIFSGPGAYDTKSTTADEEKHGTKCLIKSFKTKNPVRVIRGETDWRRSPSVGYRYDGLYQVVEKGTGTNSKNGLYTWFKLERLKDQDEINRKVPNKEQRRLEEEVIKGY